MEDYGLIEILSDALKEGITRAGPTALHVHSSGYEHVQVESEGGTSEENLLRIESALHEHPTIKNFVKPYGSQLPSFDGRFFQLRQIARWLLAQTLKRGDPTLVVGDFMEFLHSNSAEVLFVLALDGVAVTEEIELLSDVRLVPIEKLPPSIMKDGVIPKTTAISLGPRPPQATSALITTGRVGPFFLLPGEETKWEFNEFNILGAAKLCLMLSGPRAVVALSSWHQVIEAGAPKSAGGGATTYDSFDIYPTYKIKAGTFDVDLAKKVVGEFFKMNSLNSKDIESLIIPMTRLNEAIRHSSVADRAIDLGIALEALLLPEPGGELSYRLRYRAAWFVGKDVEDRKRIFKLLTDVYQLRSDAVHQGRINSKGLKGGQKAGDLLWDGINLCADLIRKIIELGKVPDWQTISLGGR